MKKWRLILLICLVTAVTWMLPHQSKEAEPLLAQDIPEDGLVVRVYFDDEETARQIAISYEPLESDYDKGYLLLAISDEEHQQLLQSDLTVEIDDNLTAHYAQNIFSTEVEGATIPGYSCYRTVEETFTSAQDIANNYPTLATWSDVGNSWRKSQGLGGYDMQVLKLTNINISGPKPKIFITSAIHAREYTTAELTTRLAEKLVSEYGINPDVTWILDNHEIHFMLQTNPDGRKQAETGILWRKNTNQNYCSSTSNSRGADLNRNFPFNWGCCGGSSGNQCSETFRGASAASEPETQAVVNYIQSNFVDARGPGNNDAAPLDTEGIYLDIHSSGRLMLWPWGHTNTPSPNGAQLQTLGRKMAYFNGHTPQQAIGLYPTDGTTTSFAYGEMGLASYTYELGTEFFQSCNYFENTLVPDNIPALMYALKAVRAPYMIPAGPDALDVAVSTGGAEPGVPAGTFVGLTATVNDTRFNNSNGSESTQNIAVAEYYIDTPPWDGGTAVSMNATDGNFNSKVEAVTANIDTTGLSHGRHIIYVRGQDVNGNWGAISADFLYINDGSTPTPTNTPPPSNDIFFDDFESNQGWSVNPNGTDSATFGLWERANPEETSYESTVYQQGSTSSGSYDLVTGSLAGLAIGDYDVDGGTTSMRSPNITLPSSGDITLSLDYYLAHYSNSGSDDALRVSVVGNTASTVLEETGAADIDGATWSNFSTSLNSYAGQTIYLLIEATDNGVGSLIEAGIDDVRITAIGGNPTPTPTNTPPITPPITPTPTNTPPPTVTPTPTTTATPNPGCAVFTSQDVPMALPNGTSSIRSEVTLSRAGIINDLNVNVDMAHDWVGDLSFTLTHVDTGTAVTILDRPGVPASSWGCSQDNISVTLDDEATTSVEGQCASGGTAIDGTYQPNNLLSAFDRENGDGTWVLSVNDAYTSVDDGILNSWSIELCTP